MKMPSPPSQVRVAASLLIDPAGRVRDGKNSKPLSSLADRERFLSLRPWADCIVIGSQTYDPELYDKSKVPVIVYSRSTGAISDWRAEFERLTQEFGPHILVEAGPKILGQLLEAKLIDQIYLTRTTRISLDESSPVFNLDLISDDFELIESEHDDEDLFETYQRSEIVRLLAKN